MLVYLMGLTDIFAAIMLVTGIKPSFILTLTIALLFAKGIASFFGKFNLLLYVLGAADLLAIVLLWQGMVLGNIGIMVLGIMLFKGFISFWQLEPLRNAVLLPSYVLTKLINKKINKVEWKDKISNYIWFGSSKIKNGRANILKPDYPKREFGYKFLKDRSKSL